MSLTRAQVEDWLSRLAFCREHYDNCPLWDDADSRPCPRTFKCKSRQPGGMPELPAKVLATQLLATMDALEVERKVSAWLAATAVTSDLALRRGWTRADLLTAAREATGGTDDTP